MDKATSDFLSALEDLDDQELTEHLAKRLVGMTGNGVTLKKKDKRRGLQIIKYELLIRLPVRSMDEAA